MHWYAFLNSAQKILVNHHWKDLMRGSVAPLAQREIFNFAGHWKAIAYISLFDLNSLYCFLFIIWHNNSIVRFELWRKYSLHQFRIYLKDEPSSFIHLMSLTFWFQQYKLSYSFSGQLFILACSNIENEICHSITWMSWTCDTKIRKVYHIIKFASTSSLSIKMVHKRFWFLAHLGCHERTGEFCVVQSRLHKQVQFGHYGSEWGGHEIVAQQRQKIVELRDHDGSENRILRFTKADSYINTKW